MAPDVRWWHSLSREEIDEVLDSRPVLIVGSAVSDFAPTNLPSGGVVATDLLDMVSRANTKEAWPQFLCDDAKQLPFEAVLEAYPHQEKIPEILQRLFGSPTIVPNSLHAAIGHALTSGLVSSLITTNYDLAFDNH